MFEYIRGKLVDASPSHAIVDVQGVGYRVMIPLSTYPKLPQVGSEVMIYLSPIIREDAHTLYGFLAKYERELFEKLIAISGIGPKTGLALVGHLDPSDLHMAISQGNIALISKVPGIGKKTAERLVVEMRDKVKNLNREEVVAGVGGKGVVADAINTLINLGYHPLQAQKAVKAAAGDGKKDPDLGALITAALRCM